MNTLGIIGSRHLQHCAAIEHAAATAKGLGNWCICTGDAAGADAAAVAAARSRDMHVVLHCADKASFGVAAFHMRNRMIVETSDVLMAVFEHWPQHPHKGTLSTVQLALKACKPVVITVVNGWAYRTRAFLGKPASPDEMALLNKISTFSPCCVREQNWMMFLGNPECLNPAQPRLI